MLKEDYSIRIVGRQSFAEEEGIEPEEVALSTTGTYTERGSARFIAYKEYDEDNPRVSHTSVLKVEDDRVTVMRPGSRLVLEQGRRHICLYDTGYGTLSLGIFTSELSSSLAREGGRLNLKYTLDIDSNLSSSHELEVVIRPCAPRKAER